MISSELPEILRMSHRIVVMSEGRVTGMLDAGEATQESVMHYATLRPEEAHDVTAPLAGRPDAPVEAVGTALRTGCSSSSPSRA